MKYLLFIFFAFLLAIPVYSQSEDPMAPIIRNGFQRALEQYRLLSAQLPADKMPQSFDEKTGKLLSRDITWWCSGFYPGSLWLIYEQTGDSAIKKEALRSLKVIEPNQYFTGNHDLGFMMFCSFGNAYRITGDQAYIPILVNAARSLTTRYRTKIKSIQSWNSSEYWQCPVIIDNMMNLEMLNWVSAKTGDKKFSEIARIHSKTTLKNHFRPDFSSYHVVDYDTATGKVRRKATWQGASNNSAWSRGQSWGFYGFLTMYRSSKDPVYLKQAKNIARFILNHPNLPADKIPYWDYDAGFMPLAKRDASAACILASALLEMGQYVSATEREEYLAPARQILKSLSGAEYLYAKGQGGGFLIRHCVGALPMNSEVDVPLIYADYYYLEALKRYKDWYLKK